MNLADLLNSADRDDSPGLTDEQQITRLTEFYEQVHAIAPERFEPGQIVWLRCGMAHPLRYPDAPRLFLGYLETPIRGVNHINDIVDLGASNAALVMDCRILAVANDDGVVVEVHADSRNFTATRRAAK